jgi:hypothetical protein
MKIACQAMSKPIRGSVFLIGKNPFELQDSPSYNDRNETFLVLIEDLEPIRKPNKPKASAIPADGFRIGS